MTSDDFLRVHDNCDTAEPDGCWTWRGPYTNGGYGMTSLSGINRLAHRITFQFMHGPIPDGKEVDHLCRNTKCCNPLHMEAVTHVVNLHRGNSPVGIHARKTHCIRGHPLSGGNLYVQKRKDGSVHRLCKACQRERDKEYQRRRAH